MLKFEFEAIGTHWRIDIFEALSSDHETGLLAAVHKRIDAFDKAYSRFRKDSLVWQMSQDAGDYRLPDDALPMMTLYRDLYERTRGLVTPLIGNLISDAGYDAAYSLKQKADLKAPPQWDDAIGFRPPMLTVKRPVLLDFGAAGKGYLVDLVGEVIESHGLKNYCIDAGGDILVKSGQVQRIGLEDPDDATKAVGVCALKQGSICGSAGNRRKWQGFTHIIDPQSLRSPTEIIAVWVTSKKALIADALATCLFFVGPASLRDGYEFEYVRIRNDRSFEKSDGFPGELFVTV